MAVSQRLLNERYERCLDCVDAEFSDMPAGSRGKIAADGLQTVFTQIQQKGAEQAVAEGKAEEGTGQRTVARINLKEWRKELARTANYASVENPGFNRKYPAPHGENDDELLTESRAVAPEAVEDEEEFTSRGLEEDFVKSGDALITAFETAFGITNTALSQKGAATGGKSSAYKQAAEFFDDLDIYIRNKYRDQPDKLNAWRVASHLERTSSNKGGGDKGGGENNPPTT
jgi:hypothetical protein